MNPQNRIQFFIIGAGRGGTSLLAGLLDQHTQLEIAFESFAQPYLMGQHLTETDTTQLLQNRLHHFKHACQQTALQYPQQLWGNKITTEHLAALEEHNQHNQHNQQQPIDTLDFFFNQTFPHSKIIFILRDGRTCVRSKINRTGQSLEQACQRWQYAVKVYQFLQRQPQNTHCLRYEDLLRQPEKTLHAICNFLAIPYQAHMLTGTDNPKMLPEYRQQQFDLEKLALTNIPDGCIERIQTELTLCGYR